MPDKHLCPGGPTGAANPLMWAHSEYVKLLRSIVDKRIFDLIEPVAQRYRNDTSSSGNRSMEDESAGAHVFRREACCGCRLLRNSCCTGATTNGRQCTTRHPRRLRWGWSTWTLRWQPRKPTPLVFTFYWPVDGNWERRGLSRRGNTGNATSFDQQKGGIE